MKVTDLEKNCHSKKIYLGIDPAKEGAAVAICKGKALFALLWKPIRKQKITFYSLRLMDVEGYSVVMANCRRLSEIGKFIGEIDMLKNKEVVLSLEDAYYKPNPKVTISVSKTAGMIAAPIEIAHNIDSHWVKASVWRHKVLRLNPFTKREQAKHASLKLIPSIVSGMDMVLHKIGNYDHLTDAAGVAYWAYQQQL